MVTSGAGLSPSARRFLERGEISAGKALDIARECDEYIRAQVKTDLSQAVKWGIKFAQRSRSLSDEVTAIALRSLGFVQQLSAAHSEAEAAYLEARKLLKREPLARACIDRALIDVYMYLGNLKEARRRARIAIRTFKRLDDSDGEAKTRINYANLLHRQDRHVDALRWYRKATAYYFKTDQKFTLAACHYNCANSLVQLLEFDEADRLYREAEKLFQVLGHDLYVNEARYGRAWLDKLRGNYHLSLRALADCEEYYRLVGQPRGAALCQLDRAEVMLELDLLSDARALAREAEKNALHLRITYEAAKAALFQAKAAYGLGAKQEARKALHRAAQGFRRVDNAGMLAVAQFYKMLFRSRRAAPAGFESVRGLFRKAQLPLWQAVCDLSILVADMPDPDRSCFRRLQKNRSVQTVPHLFAGWKVLLGDMAFNRNDVGAAKRNWTRAADVLDQMRSKLPPIDVRQSLAARNLDPYQRMFRSELHNSAEDAAVWSERSKTAGIWSQRTEQSMPQERQRINEQLTQLAERVTALSVSLERTRGEVAVQNWPQRARFHRLQSMIRRELLASGGRAAAPSTTHDEVGRMLRKSSASGHVVQLHHDGERLVAFVHYRGDTRAHVYEQSGQALRSFLGQWNILLGETLTRGRRWRTADRDEEQRLLSQLGDWLWTPLEIPSEQNRIAIITSGSTGSLPWSAMRVDGRPLIERHTFVLAPSISHLFNAGVGDIKSKDATVFVGHTGGLRHTDDEISIVSQLAGSSVTIRRRCLRQDWPKDGEARLWHYVGHAQYRGDNPFYSSLTLADGPLFAADFRMRNCKIGLVTLAACRTGVQSSVPSYECTGLVRSLLEMGAKNVVASQWAVSDRATANWMRSFYALLSSGQPLMAAMRSASLEMRNIYPSAAQWAAFSLFGAGNGFGTYRKNKSQTRRI